MKISIKGLLAATTLALGFAGQANAALLTETYSAPPAQAVYEGDSYSFGFDFLVPNVPGLGALTDSNMDLTQDVALGELTNFSSMTLTLALASSDWEKEKTQIGIYVRDFDLENVTYTKIFDFSWNGVFYDPYFVQTFVLPSGFVSAFNQSLYSDIVIKASRVSGYVNDFSIYSVSLSGTTTSVPEPASLALLGLGLVGIGAVARRRNKR